MKLAGSFLVIVVSLLYGWKVKEELKSHVDQLVGMKEMLLMLQGEISYARTPLKEAFWQMSSQGKEPFAAFLKKAVEEMDGNEESIGKFWGRLVEEAENFSFSQEEKELLKRVGENFGYLDTQMQLKNLELYLGQVDALIQKAQKELKDRQKVASVVSLMCGLFLVILLI